MAGFWGPTRKELLTRLRRAAELPITLGDGAPQAVVERDGEDWVLRLLVHDRAALERAHAESTMWVPEMEFQFLVPGEAIVRAKTQQAFVAAIEAMDWRWSS
jgi:hypothetical protein